LNLRKKTGLSVLSGSLCIEQGFFHKFPFDNRENIVEFRICWKRSKFKRCQIRIQTSLHL